MSNVAQAKARFRGVWHVDRHILDLDSEWLGRFDGQAMFEDHEGHLAYHEEGILKFGGLTGSRATRDYIWTFPDVTYDFRKYPQWRAEWRVEGPKKDYRMVTTYRREA